jgi:single-stranded DNA-binding protein
VSIACQFDDSTTWVRVTFWEKQAEALSKYCNKGDRIQVTGFLRENSWEKDGVQHKTLEVTARDFQMLGDKTERREPQQNYPEPPGQRGGQDDSDTIPF